MSRQKDQLHIRLPEKLSKIIENETEEGGFTSKAELLRHLIRERGNQ